MNAIDHDTAPNLARRRWLQGCCAPGLLLGTAALWPQAQAWAEEDPTEGDPLGSMQWPVVRRAFIGDEPFQFSPEVQIQGPPFAEDAMNVPVMLDARPLQRQGIEIDRIRIVADRNPVQHVLDFMPQRALPVLAFRFRMEQASPVRAMVRSRQGRWYVGHTWIQAAGGGCTVPGATRSDGSWNRTLNQVQARLFRDVLHGDVTRLRVRVMHPMDTGLVAGIPSFHIEALELRDGADRLWWQLELHEPISENPLITVEMPGRLSGTLLLQGRDNGGNPIRQEIQA